MQKVIAVILIVNDNKDRIYSNHWFIATSAIWFFLFSSILLWCLLKNTSLWLYALIDGSPFNISSKKETIGLLVIFSKRITSR